MNYFEHEQKVRYVEGILSKSLDWDWLINYIEQNFSVDLTINAFDDFFRVYTEIADVFRYFNSINKYIESELCINQDWLKIIYDFSLYSVGKKKYEELPLDTDFEKEFELLIYLAKLHNETNDKKYVIYAEIFNCKNLYKIIDVSSFSREEAKIVERLQGLSFDTSKESSFYKSNIDKEFASCNNILTEKHSDLISANCFSFQNLKKYEYQTWEESYLIDMVSVSYENGKIIPRFTYTDGKTAPDFEQWTEDVLHTMKVDFDNPDADYIIESIEYMLYGKMPTEYIIIKHIDLLNDYYNELNKNSKPNYQCSSLEILLSVLSDKNTPFYTSVITKFNAVISKIKDVKTLVYIDSKYPIRDKKLHATIQKYIQSKLLKIEHINDFSSFDSFISDDDIIRQSDNSTFERISDIFESVLLKCDGVHISCLFLRYLQYLLRIKQNRNITASEISKEINYIRHLWQDEYFEVSASSMQTFQKGVSLDKTSIEKHNNGIIDYPFSAAYSCMILSEDAIVKSIERITSNPLMSLVTKISINDDFPFSPQLILDKRHEVDLYYRDRVEKVKKEKSYRFINDFSIKEILPGIYNDIKHNISFSFSIFHKDDILYQSVKQINKEYDLLEYSEEPTLAHLVQLFPILECKLRDIGECFGISPIREDINHYNKLKDPTTVLKKIIKIIFDETQSLEQGADFIFIFFTMFAENGINIRNSCIHGVAYNKNKHEIAFAFKVTLFCLHLIEYRLNKIQENGIESVEDDSE